MIAIRKSRPEDEDAIWDIIRKVIASGDTYVFDPKSTREDMLAFWCSKDKHTYVATIDDRVVGTFIIKDNHPGLGSHIANAAYMTAPEARGLGVGKTMGLYSIEEARKLGYRAMQFNIVVASNTNAVNLWKKIGFEIIGEIPEAFNHQTNGYTNAYIMYRRL